MDEQDYLLHHKHAIILNSIADITITLSENDEWIAECKGMEVERDVGGLITPAGRSKASVADAIDALWEQATLPAGTVVRVPPNGYSYTKARLVWKGFMWREAPAKTLPPPPPAPPASVAPKQSAEDLLDYRPKPAGFAGEPA